MAENHEKITKEERILENAVSDDKGNNAIIKGKLVEVVVEYHCEEGMK